MSKRGCYMMWKPGRYNTCQTCGHVRRAWWAKPILNNGGKP